MRTFRMLSVLAMVFSGTHVSFGQAIEAEVPGDHFSLEGALELFKKSESPEEFERLLNSPDSKVNNLDLNGDGYIDYIRVHDRYERNVHAFIIQAAISDREAQDIAVITLEKLADGKAVLQIIGDEDIYGVETIIEPTQEVRTYAGANTNRTVVNVWTWPSVRYVYSPYYTGWVSPWGWHDHPVWWRPWRPVAYVHYQPIWRPYYSHYSLCHTRRVVYANHIYHPHRSTSVIVHHRHRDQVSRYRSHYNDRDRDRYDGRRSYVDNNASRRGAHPERGSDSYRNRNNASLEASTPSDGRSSSRQRNTVRDNQRTIETGRDANVQRRETTRPITTPEKNRQTNRQEQSSPDLNKYRSSGSEPARPVRQSSSTNERSTRTEVQRPSEIQKSNVPATRSTPNLDNYRSAPTRSSSVDRRSTQAPNVQRSSPAPSVQRSTPAPSVQRSTPRSSPSHATPQRSSSRSGAARPAENNRGRQ